MRLDEIETREQMEAALEEGDRELERDIQREVEQKVYRAHSYATYENLSDSWTTKELVDRIMEMTNAGRAIWELEGDSEALEIVRQLPWEVVEQGTRYLVEQAVDNLPLYRGSLDTVLVIVSDSTVSRDEIEIQPVYMEVQVAFEEPLVWVPEETIEDALGYALGDADWTVIDRSSDRVDYGSGWIESDSYWILKVNNYDGLYEAAIDMRTEYYSELVDADPKTAVTEFARVLQTEYPELYKQVKKAKLPQDVLLGYAVAYFEDPEEGIETISEAMGNWGYEGTRADTILEIDRALLQSLGIPKGGRFYDGAPWKLLNLPPSELAYEGTVQRHCVGRRDMGYRDAVRDGRTEIWSLRSSANKPLLTFEVDKREWDYAETPAERGNAIEQVKGKTNRLGGETEDEAKVLYYIFSQLDVDPTAVSDFRPVPVAGWGSSDLSEMAASFPRAQMNPRSRRARSFDAPWCPYGQAQRAARAQAGQRKANPAPAKRRKAKKNPSKRRKGMSPALRKLLRGL